MFVYLIEKSALDGGFFSIKCGTKKPVAFQLKKANDIKFPRASFLPVKVTRQGFVFSPLYFYLKRVFVRSAQLLQPLFL